MPKFLFIWSLLSAFNSNINFIINRVHLEQACQMVYFYTIIPYLGIIFDGLGMKFVGIYVYAMVIWNIMRPFGIFYGHLVYFSLC
jgi:hypothetical protein